MLLTTAGALTVSDKDADGTGIQAGTSGNVLLEARGARPLTLIVPSPVVLHDGSLFTIERREGNAVLQRAVFEFDHNGSTLPGNFLVAFTPASTADEVARAIVAQIQAARIGLAPRHLGPDESAIPGVVYLGVQTDHVVDVSRAPNLLLAEQPGVADGDVGLRADVCSGSGPVRVLAGGCVTQDADISTGAAGTVSVTAEGPIVLASTAGLQSAGGAVRLESLKLRYRVFAAFPVGRVSDPT